jgi:RecA/RadA recombinase
LKPKAKKNGMPKRQLSAAEQHMRAHCLSAEELAVEEDAAEVAEPEVEAEQAQSSAMLDIDGDAVQSSVQKLLKMSAFEPTHRYWLDLGNEYANAVFGSREKGVPYGKVMEISGAEHCGKTLISNVLMGMAQQDGAAAGYIDLEDSRDGIWSTKLGVNWAAVTKFYYELVMASWKCKCGATNPGSLEPTQFCTKCGKPRKGIVPPPTLLSAEQIFEQAESAMYKLSKLGAQKQFWFLDSIAMIVTAKQYEVGLADSSMNSKLDRAMFLSTLLPRWSGIAANYNATILVSNQLRAKFGFTGYGDSDETTGGKALRHVCSIRIRGRRVKGGRLKNGKQVVGLAGALRNVKNKAGEGSQEGCECGFKILWNRPKASVDFMSIDELNKEMGGDD